MHARTNRPLRGLPVGLAAAALFAPTTIAANEGNGLLRNDLGHYGNQPAQPTADVPALMRNDIGHFGNRTTRPTSTPPTTRAPASAPAIVVRVDEGFDWISAGVGAAGGFGCALLAGGAVSVLRRRVRTDAVALSGR